MDEPQPAAAPPAAAGGRFGSSIRKSGYLRKWFLLGITIGVVAGLGAVVFYLALKYTAEFLLGYLAGYHVPTPVGEGGSHGSAGFLRPWAIPLVTTAPRPNAKPVESTPVYFALRRAVLAALFSVDEPSWANFPPALSRCARTNHWNFSRSRAWPMRMS